MKLQWNSSLGTKFGSLLSIVAVAVILFLTVLSINRERNNFEQDLVNQASLLLNISVYNIRDPLYQLQLDEMADYARIVDEHPEVTLFVVYDKDGRKLVDSTYDSNMPFSQAIDPQGAAILAIKPGGQFRRWEGNQLLVGQPVILGNQVIGAVATALSTQQLDEKIAEITKQSIMLAIAAISASILVAFGMTRQITTPLRDLTSVTTAMSHGDLSTRVKTKSTDEIGHLAEAFNNMANSIQERESDLRTLANKLEKEVEARTTELREKNIILEEQAITDALTKAHNRRHFFQLAYYSIEHTRRSGEPLSIILLDADHFKSINDTYGHQAGDEILIELVKNCEQVLRKSDVFARYGGEEFIVLMPNTSKETAYITAERLRTMISKEPLKYKEQSIKLTISLGIAGWSGQTELDLDEMITNADKALYAAKQAARNRIAV